MNIRSKRELVILFLGDIFFFLVALWLMLLVRYGNIPDSLLWDSHILPFSIIFSAWILVFFIAGLYEKHTIIFKSRLPSIILRAQIINSVIAIIFFYAIPYFTITPKTNLFIDIILSLAFIYIWRVHLVSVFGFRKKEKALLVGSGPEMDELMAEVNGNIRYNLSFSSFLDLDKIKVEDIQDKIANIIDKEDISTVVIDLHNTKIDTILSYLYSLIFSNVKFIDKYNVYEDIFDRVPLSMVDYNWVLDNISSSVHSAYDFIKRVSDIVLALTLGLISIIIYPFVYIAIKLDDGGDIFIKQERIGKDNKKIHIVKFRTMSGSDRGKDVLNSTLVVTRVGRFLRSFRIDELPQLWNVIVGELSLIGPRPEFPALAEKYNEDVPYYNVRHLIKPGLSGWAQIYHDKHPHHGTDVEETKKKLSYDLYYIKNRSMFLDLKITLKTIKTILSRSGV